MKKYVKIILGVSVIIVVAIAFVWLRNQNQTTAANQYQTVKAERGSLMATIGGTGIVRSNQSATLTWITSGTVGSIFVKIGDKITKGDVLASISSDSLPQNVILAQADLVNNLRALENVKNSKTTQAQAQLALANAQKAYEDAKYTRANLVAGRDNKDAAANAEAQYIIAKKNLEGAQANYDRLASLPDDDPNKAQAYSAPLCCPTSCSKQVECLELV
jgi:multidrug efflux pump subunit AcrA (membrane-fusion protein)